MTNKTKATLSFTGAAVLFISTFGILGGLRYAALIALAILTVVLIIMGLVYAERS